MNIFKMRFKNKLLLIFLLASSNYLCAASPFQQKFTLKTTTAQIDNTIPFKITCPTCIQTIKENNHTYYLRFAAPSSPFDYGDIAFTYYYGDKHNSCIYNAKAEVFILKEGRVVGALLGSGADMEARLDAKSTSTSCPPRLEFFLEDTTPESSTLYIDR